MLAPQDGAREALAENYRRMIEDGLLLDEGEPFNVLMDQCAELAVRELGFDVAFAGPGQMVMLQFKLGQELSHFRRQDPADPIPALAKPFWRYQIDMVGHQFFRLAEYEVKGADVFYVAPSFSTGQPTT